MIKLASEVDWGWWEHGRMRIEGEIAGQPIREAWVELTRAEAERLKVVLDHMVGPDADLDPEWHAHVEGEDGQSVIAIGWDLR